MKPTSNAPYMSRGESGSESSSSSSEGSDTDQSEKPDSELIITSPAVCSDAKDNLVSPSQHKSSMANQMAGQSVVPKSTLAVKKRKRMMRKKK